MTIDQIVDLLDGCTLGDLIAIEKRINEQCQNFELSASKRRTYALLLPIIRKLKG